MKGQILRQRAFLGELLGTFLLVLLTVGSAANAVLEPRLSPGAYGYDAVALGGRVKSYV